MKAPAIVVDSVDNCIDRCADICRVIKEQFYPNAEWRVAYRPVAEIFTTIKEIMRRIMPYTTDDELLLHLKGYSMEDLAEVYERKDAHK